MKSIAAILAVVLVYVNAVEEKEVLHQWNNFQAKFAKTYRSPVEARKRFLIFKSNLELIETHNSLFEKGLTTFTMGTNQFADWTQNEFEQFMNRGLLNRTRIQSDEFFIKTPGFVAPQSVDWRQKGLVTPVKDQGTCGGCWAFSTVGAIEGQLAQSSTGLVSLSEQNLIDCSKEGGNKGCKGGLMTAGYDYVKENGIASEKDYPFQESDGKCRADEFASVTTISGYVNIPSRDEAALIEALATKGPISVGVDASSSFHLYKSGIFSGKCSTTNLHHAILAVGYGSENGKEFYIVKNSWGTAWGEEGYIRIARNRGNKCGIATDATYPKI